MLASLSSWLDRSTGVEKISSLSCRVIGFPPGQWKKWRCALYKMTPAKLQLAMASMGQRETKVGDLCKELGDHTPNALPLYRTRCCSARGWGTVTEQTLTGFIFRFVRRPQNQHPDYRFSMPLPAPPNRADIIINSSR